MYTVDTKRRATAENDSGGVRGIEMEDDEASAYLEERGHGTLALVSDDAACAVPVSFGYDGDRVFLNLPEFGGESESWPSQVEPSEPA